jgi:hypothetical protein
VGADRRRPLAAFVVIAIIAAVLLVTSVRSQAAPGWLDPEELPVTDVAAPPATDPHLWGVVTSGVHQVVQDGVVLTKRATSEESVAEDPTLSLVASTTSSDTASSDADDSGNVVTSHAGHTTPDHGQRPHHPRHHDDADDSDEPSGSSWPSPHDHGHHYGWDHGNGHHGHGNGHGHGTGHGRSH